MNATCAVCAASFPARTRTARYCGDACRMRASRARRAGRPLPDATAGDVTASLPSGVEAAVVVELCERGLLDSAVGAQALALARRIDAGTDALAGIAAASRQLEVLRLAWSRSPTEEDPVDALIARRRERLATTVAKRTWAR